MRLSKEFYTKSALDLAPLLIGKYLCRKIDGEVIKCLITETEAYYGFDDTASHAHCGKTNRTKTMFEEGGIAYVYLCYGIHYLFNIVTGPKDHPEAVLIRGVKDYSGPARVTKFLKIDKSFNNCDLLISEEIWLEDNNGKFNYIATPRVGIGYADEKDRNICWRFIAIK